MDAFVWQNVVAQAAAIAPIRGRAAVRIPWPCHVAIESSVGTIRPFASIVHAVGDVTGELVILERCRGMAGNAALWRCRAMLRNCSGRLSVVLI